MSKADWAGEQLARLLKWARKHPTEAVVYLVMIYIGLTILKAYI